MNGSTKPDQLSAVERDYSRWVVIPENLESSKSYVVAVAASLGMKLTLRSDASLQFRERLHGLSLPKAFAASFSETDEGTTVAISGGWPGTLFSAGDASYVKWLIDSTVQNVVSLAPNQADQSSTERSRVVEVLKRQAAWERSLTYVQRIPVVLLAPVIVVSALSPAWLDLAMLPAWMWIAAIFCLGAETLRRRLLGAEALSYLVMTIAWAVAALGFSIWYLLKTGVL